MFEADKIDPAATEASKDARARRVTEKTVVEGRLGRIGMLFAGATACAVVFFYLQFQTDAILDVDGYYHVKWSRLLWEGLRHGAFPPAFPWLPLTSLNPNDYVDHHLLFHILLIPFTWFGDLRVGAKVAAATFGALAVVSCFWLVVRYRIKYSPVWLVALLACSAPFLFRLSMTRAQSVSIVFMVAGIFLLFERRYWLLAPLAFLYVWTYSLWVMLGAAAVIWAGAILWSERRIEWRPVVWTGVGTILGFILNPYFPKNVMLFAEHVVMKVKPTEFTTSVGAEWYPYESWYFLGSCAVAFVAMVVGYVAFDWTDKRRAARPLFFLIFSTILLIINARSRRFVEYWPPFAILFAAFALQPIFDGARNIVSRLSSDMRDELKPFLDRHEPPAAIEVAERKRVRAIWTAIFVTALLGVPLYFNIHYTAETIRSDSSPFAYQKGMEWIRTNVPRGELVFNTDWDDFPKLFFFDADHRYASGLDPTYLLDENPELSDLYKKVTLGEVGDTASIIRNRFGARYVFTDKEEVHDAFYNAAMDSGWFEEVYDDENCTVLRILEERREEPPPPADPDDPADPADTQTDPAPPPPPAGETGQKTEPTN